MSSPSLRPVPSRSPRPIRMSSTSVQARPTFAATWRRATASTNQPTPARTGSTSGSRKGRSARWLYIRTIRISPLPRYSATPSALIRNAASIAPRTAARSGNAFSSRTPTRAPRTCAWTRRTRASCSPAYGRRGAAHGNSPAAVRAAACTCRATAAIPGRSLSTRRMLLRARPARDSPMPRGARSASLWRRRTASAFTH